jgi:CubicO group peptidase (beta-lactamase class C family)
LIRRLISRVIVFTGVLAAAVTTASLAGARVQPAADSRFDVLAALVTESMAKHHIPGVALGIVESGMVTTRAFGVTNVDDPLPITTHTVFPIASISKTIAATAMMRLVEQGRVDLRAPVRKYLPDFHVQDEAVSREVTVWHLLTHTSGWEGQVAPPDRGDQALKAFVDGMGTLMQIAPPGAAWSYNNAGFSVAGRVIEVVTGQSINAAIRDLVLKPLGLEHAGTNPAEFLSAPRFALGHFNRGDNPATPQRPFSPSTSLTAGGVGLCLTDLLTYARFHLGDGTANGERVLTKATLDLMKTPQLRKQGNDDDIGLPWHLRRVGGVLTAAHGGTLGGHILLLELLPERNAAIGILTNASNGWRLIQDVERAALKAYAGATFATNQAIAHRGLVETLPMAQPLATQPDPTPYVGRYLRPMNAVVVRADGGRVFVQVRPNSGGPQPEMPVVFYGPDRAVVTGGTDQGQSIEFVRASDGRVRWIRVTGRIAVRETEK